MRRCSFVPLVLTAAVALSACAIATSRSSPAPAERGQRASGGYLIGAADLQADGRPLLELLRLRVPVMGVQGATDCPHINFRGRNTLFTRSDPAIHVDGLHASNTCILSEMSTIDLERVEIYPSGIPRAGYRTNPNGVILIFVRKGDFPAEPSPDEEPVPR
ncbi:MAG: hypothetical protein M3373_11135 [Gemmatimonadota bacterium]|nr:hypothetical protein [Gemmatimonadota bacterium]